MKKFIYLVCLQIFLFGDSNHCIKIIEQYRGAFSIKLKYIELCNYNKMYLLFEEYKVGSSLINTGKTCTCVNNKLLVK